MVTLKQLFQTFGHDPKWGRLATQSAQPMVSVFMRKLGDTDITTLTDFDIEMQLAMSEQPEDRKVKARSCMHYLLRWAREQGKEVSAFCAIGDEKVIVYIDGEAEGRLVPYGYIVEQAREYIHVLGGFERFAEWGLIR